MKKIRFLTFIFLKHIFSKFNFVQPPQIAGFAKKNLAKILDRTIKTPYLCIIKSK